MKFVKKLFIIFVFSFLIATSGVKAYISRFYPGTKQIELRTALYFLDTTSISGTWYLSKNDYLS